MRKDKIKELIGRSLYAFNTKIDKKINENDYKNKQQDHKINALIGNIDDNFITKEEPSNIVSLENSIDGALSVEEIQGNTKYVRKDGTVVDTFEEGVSLKSVGENCKISILSTGKNLFDVNKIVQVGEAIKPQTNSILINGWVIPHNNILKLKPNTKYNISLRIKVLKESEGTTSDNSTRIYIRKGVEGAYDYKSLFSLYFSTIPKKDDVFNINNSFTTPKDVDNYDKLLFYSLQSDINKNGTIEMSDIYVSEFSTQISFEPYKQDKKEILIKEPLRGLPNGVGDSVENLKLTRKCGEIIITGNKAFTDFWETDSHIRMITIINNHNGGWQTAKVISDRFPYNADKAYYALMDCIASDSIGRLYISLSKSKLKTPNVEGFKQWLKENPTTVIYELGTPIIEDIDIGQATLLLKCFEKGTLCIEDDIQVGNVKVRYDALIPMKNNTIQNKRYAEFVGKDINDSVFPTLMDLNYRCICIQLAQGKDISDKLLLLSDSYKILKRDILSKRLSQDEYLYRLHDYLQVKRITQEQYEELKELIK